MMDDRTALDATSDREGLLDYLWRQSGPQKRTSPSDAVRLGWRNLRAKMRHKEREASRAASADTYNPWERD